MKTAKELLKELPVGWYEDACLYNVKRGEPDRMNCTYLSISDCIERIVVWSSTVAGREAWFDLVNYVSRHEGEKEKEYPEYPCIEKLVMEQSDELLKIN